MQNSYHQKGMDTMKNLTIRIIILCLLTTILGLTSYANITPVNERTAEVRDAIVDALSDVDSAADVTETHLSTITALNLRAKSITALQSGDFSGLTALTNLNLYNNQLSSLPDSIFKGLTALTTLRLGSNTVDPLPNPVLLEKDGDGQFKAVVPAGAPFDIVVPITATNGSISGGTTTLTVTKGSTESGSVTVTRTDGTTDAVTADIGTVPSLPANHYGYTLAKFSDLPLEVISEIETPPTTDVTPSATDVTPPTTEVTPPNAPPTFTDGSLTVRSIAENTAANTNIGATIVATDADEDTLTYTLSGTDVASYDIDATTGQLKTKAALDYESKRIYSVTISVSDGNLTDSISVIISVIDVVETAYISTILHVSDRTAQIRDAIVDAVSGIDTAVDVTDAHLATITELNLRNEGITELKSGDFAGLTALTSLNLYGNMLSTLPIGIFDGLTALTSLRLGGNTVSPMPLIVSVQQVSSGHFKAVIPAGAPFDVSFTVNGNTVTIPKGSIESAVFMSSSIASIGTLPTLPANHFGYVIAKSTVCNRTQQVSVGIVAALTGITDCRNVSDAHLAQITELDLSDTSITSLAADDFDGMLSLTSLDLSDNQLSNLPDGIFSVLPSLNVLDLSGNTVDPFPISVMLEKVGTDQIKVVIPTGTPFNMMLPINVVNGSLAGNTDAITLMQDSVESQPLTITRTLNTLDAVTVDIGTLPNLPANHIGYVLTKTNDTPLTIFDAINVAPVFTEGTTTIRTIAENTAAGTNIGNPISATDANNDTLTYTLSGTDAASFNVGSTTGQLQTKTALDYETKKTYSVMVVVSDGSLTDAIDVTINITDVDEAPPVVVEDDEDVLVTTDDEDTNVVSDETQPNRAPAFTEGTITTRSVAENTTSGVDIGAAVSATDADGDTLTYTLGGTDAVSFSIDSTNGQLRTNAALDFETKDSYSVTVSVSDGIADADTITVTISVSDVVERPDNTAPEFTEGISTSRTIAENTGSGVNIGTPVSATDADSDTLTYSLSSTDAGSFSIDSSSGQLRTSAALDYETKTSYSVNLTVSDGNGGSDSISVTITVTDVDEAPTNTAPAFTEGDSASRFVDENTGSGVDIGSVVSATDADGDTLTYSLGGTDAASFSIDSSSGQLRTSSALDYETKNTYSVIVSVSDDEGSSDSISITITVNDIDETPVNNAPAFTAGSITTLPIAENTAANTNIDAAVTATDADGHTLTYGLTGIDAASFDIDSTTGQLITKIALNHETKSSYSVTVSVSDGQGGSDSISVTISVTDVNEAPTFATASTTRSIAERTAAGINIGAAVVATDPDANANLTYTLGGTDAASFDIDSRTGQIKTKAALNFDTQKIYTVSVAVSDGTLTDSITVTISVIDLDETPSNNPPVFTEGETADRRVAENTAANTNIGDPIAATDVDVNKLAYTMSGDDAAAFSIDLNTGQIKTNAALNYESKDTYEVTVTVNDGGETDTITVTIEVTDVNEAPVYASETTRREIAENTTSNTNIGNPVTATDPDDGDTLTYTLGGTDTASFDIDESTGQLKTKAALDFETLPNIYSLSIIATDTGNLSDSIAVTVTVTDIDENRHPVFDEGDDTERSIAENTGAGVDIGEPVSATDPDEDDELTYTLGGTDAASFNIGSTNGQLRTKAALDYETQPNTYTVIVTVSDSKLTDTINVTIKVTDVDENRPPVFDEGDSTERSVAENTGAGVDIGDPVSASDPDEDFLTYSLGGTDADSFDIGSTDGQLRTKVALDFETLPNTYTVTVTASDSKLSDTITVTITETDVDENRPPAFATESTARNVAENTPANTDIGAPVTADDPDNDTLTYTLGGTDAASFDIVETTGQLKTKAAFDYETPPNSYTVTITASDSKLEDTITVTITVTDVDENRAPVFASESTTRAIAENTPANTDIGAPVSADDPDNDTLTYTLGGTDADSFSIVETTGQLKTNAALDYETQPNSYTVTVTASDGKLTDTITVTITETNVDENRAPTFTEGDDTTRSIIENTAAGTNIGSAVSATDLDTDDTLTYTLGGTDASSFDIVDISGQLQTKAALDFETKDSYTVTITVSDGNGGEDIITVAISITNDTTENNPPVFTDGTSTTRSVEENTEAGTNVGNPVSATDKDDDTLIYSISGTDAASYRLNSSTGQIITVAPLNYERNPSDSVTITVTDGNGGSDSIAVTIEITDIRHEISEQKGDNNAPVFDEGDSTTRDVEQGTRSPTYIGKPIRAMDADGDDLTYTLSGTDAASFTIDNSTGRLITSAALDYETKASYSVTVTVYDGEGGSDTISVTIRVTVAPVFSDGETATRTIVENSVIGSNVGDPVSATDVDNDTLEYGLTTFDFDNRDFNVNSATGQITTKIVLDYEKQSTYTCRLFVIDEDDNTDHITVTINITNVEESPVFEDGTSTTRSVVEKTSSGTDFDKPVSATPDDSDGPLTYTLSGTDSASFDISSTTGQLQTNAALDYEGTKTYSVEVTATDTQSRSTSISVTIKVLNISIEAGGHITPIADRTDVVSDLIVQRTGASAAYAVTEQQLAAIITMDFNDLPGIGSSSLSSLKVGDFDGMSGLETLTIGPSHKLTSLPAGIFDNLTSLERLTIEWAYDWNVSSFGLTGLPDNVFDNLTSLERLDLSRNRISSLPEGVFDNLTSLESLALDNNKLTSLPSGIFDNNTDLTHLYLFNNSITSFSSGVFNNLTELHTLSLSHNNVNTLTSGLFDKLADLRSLSLSNMGLTSLPNKIFYYNTNLRSLALENNALTSLSANAFEGHIFLETLNFSNNSLSSLPDGLFTGLTKLNSIIIDGNTIDPLPLTVKLEKVGTNGFKAKIPVGSPNGVNITLSVTNGSITGGHTRINVAKGSTESSSTYTVTRTAGTTDAVTVNITGYSFTPTFFVKGFNYVNDTSLPLTVIAANAAPSLQTNPIPDETALLSNFPNPFNPETWIPYQLAISSDVSLTIYNIGGVVVREIALKQQPAGFYRTRDRAIHWNGRNMLGEKVAGGMYFYIFKVGDYSATRKMLILK